jgi:hypothetical protein
MVDEQGPICWMAGETVADSRPNSDLAKYVARLWSEGRDARVLLSPVRWAWRIAALIVIDKKMWLITYHTNDSRRNGQKHGYWQRWLIFCGRVSDPQLVAALEEYVKRKRAKGRDANVMEGPFKGKGRVPIAFLDIDGDLVGMYWSEGDGRWKKR